MYIEISYCGTRIDLFAIDLGGPQNAAWRTRQLPITVQPCSNEFAQFRLEVYAERDAADADYLITLGFDNFQFIP